MTATNDPSAARVPVTLDGLAWRIQQVVDAQLDAAQSLGMLVASMARLEADVRELRAQLGTQRGKLDSVPELVDERVQTLARDAELASWHKRVAWTAKVIGAVVAGLLLLYLGRFVPR